MSTSRKLPKPPSRPARKSLSIQPAPIPGPRFSLADYHMGGETEEERMARLRTLRVTREAAQFSERSSPEMPD